ncbi:MAG TPA: alpha-glucuronidase family glycosyl hydrolase [Acidobacteriaceae bacterium]|nr:alpha-glucuronidase family glycosyl hydrolase [Acidobacteriaceae bacterium]
MRARWLKPLLAVALALQCATVCAEDGSAGWLRYAPLANAQPYRSLPAAVVPLDHSPVVESAAHELSRGLGRMLGHPVLEGAAFSGRPEFVIGTVAEVKARFPQWKPAARLKAEGFAIATVQDHGHTDWVIAGADARGALYGTFHLLQQVAEEKDPASFATVSSPAEQVRWVDEWDNLNGSIERGYAGRSIFFANGDVRADLTRAGKYARLLASVGINGCTVNNVNANVRMLTPQMISQLARIADAFRPWGVRLAISVALSSPKAIGGLDTFDPKNPKVIAWWNKTVDAIYAQIPDFAGFVVKADSEGQPGPSKYGRTPADAANMLARALKPHGGVLLYRAFVYNHHLDWRDLKADRARAAYDIFHPLDGKFDDNVIIQIKYGPIDFQVREPASPLFAGLRHTNEAMELEITQEYTGQQRQLVYLVPLWKHILDFDMRAGGRYTPVKQIVEGRSFDRPLGGFAGVANVGLDANWMGHPLAMANLYGFGRLAWNPDLMASAIAGDWTRLTFGNNPHVVSTIDAMLLSSWHIYEQYTGPLGLGTLTNILGPHYGPDPQSAEHNGWGQWIRAGHEGVGMDRTEATGTGYIGQYPPAVARRYESLETCPDHLLLFMHHVPYTYRLHAGPTVIQYLYNAHYAGAEGAANYVAEWNSLKGRIDNQRYEHVLRLLTYQAQEAVVWRDAINDWFHAQSGIADAEGRVGFYPNRIEAELMHLNGYVPVTATPWETASGGKAVACKDRTACSVSTKLTRPAGSYTIAVQYFDFQHGVSAYTLLLNDKIIATWKAEDTLPGGSISGDTSTRFTISHVALHPGDVLKVEGRPNGGEPAPIDYVEITSTSFK